MAPAQALHCISHEFDRKATDEGNRDKSSEVVTIGSKPGMMETLEGAGPVAWSRAQAKPSHFIINNEFDRRERTGAQGRDISSSDGDPRGGKPSQLMKFLMSELQRLPDDSQGLDGLQCGNVVTVNDTK